VGLGIIDTKEGEAMKRHWLRGVLLGVSLVLLVSGGVALAQGMSVTVDKSCIQCWPGPPAPEEDYYVTVTFAGWNHAYDVYAEILVNGEVGDNCGPCNLPSDPYVIGFMEPCPGVEPFAAPKGLGAEPSAASDGIEDLYGVWTWHMWQPATGESAQATNLFAEDCAAAEFVPEPGSILLLGSGLAGLAGYATLRWRTRE
jgi:hypothetical protein